MKGLRYVLIFFSSLHPQEYQYEYAVGIDTSERDTA